MTAALQKVERLMALAVNSGAAPGEARNAALAAVKLIKSNGLLVVEKLLPPRVETPAPGERIIRSRYNSPCRLCGDPIEVGERVYWTKGTGVRHVRCAT